MKFLDIDQEQDSSNVRANGSKNFRARKITIQQLADGRIYSAQQAKEHRLIDEIGYLDDAINLAKRAAGLNEAKVVRYHRQGGYHPNIYAQMGGGSPGIMIPNLDPLTLATFLGGTTPAFLYLWLP